jgi:hypothetical protein
MVRYPTKVLILGLHFWYWTMVSVIWICKMIAVKGGHQHFEGTDKCYRLVGDFVTENRGYPGSWIPFGSSACLTPREWGIVGPM